jgi:hypothetical protein
MIVTLHENQNTQSSYLLVALELVCSSLLSSNVPHNDTLVKAA